MKKTLLPFLSLFLLAGCSTTTVDYVGNTYPPTTHADVFYSKKDIHENYTLMGKMIMDADEGTTSEKIQQQILATAESKGADGVLITSFDKVKVGANTDYDSFGWDDIGIGGFWEGFGPMSANTQYIQDLQIIAFFLKYNDEPVAAVAAQAQVPAPPVQMEGSLG